MSATDGSDAQVNVVSTGNLYAGLTWSRSSTTLSITSTAHGLANGDVIVVRNTNVDYQYGAIFNVSTNAFDITVGDTGGTSGTAGAYIPGFKSAITQTGGDVTAVALTAATNQNCFLNSVRIIANNQESAMVVTVPSSISNGAGGFTSKLTLNPAFITGIGTDGSGTSTVLSTVSTQYQLGSNFGQISVSGVDAFGPIMVKLAF